MDPDGMVALLNYREDGITPYFTFFKDGLKEEKLVSINGGNAPLAISIINLPFLFISVNGLAWY